MLPWLLWVVHFGKYDLSEVNMNDEDYMREAIAEALKGKGQVDPNPMVGALIVEDGAIVARGYHAKYGDLHAERNAFNNLGREPKPGAVMYVTLEPCSTVGKTDACTKYILLSGIKKVVIGSMDPTEENKENGVLILREAGVEVITGVLEQECLDLNPEFFKVHGKN